jgi:L-ascorbate metabolism protein UlaG (beta-lactamase superfamily)
MARGIVPLVTAAFISIIAGVALRSGQQQQARAALQARFIGQMAFAISDGSVTVVTDFPYQIGYVDAPAYSPKELSGGSSTLALITHQHLDHWEPALFAKTTWKVAGPDDVISSVAADRVVALKGTTTWGAVQIEPLETPHARIGHYSYIVTWQGKRLYFSGDTEDARSVILAKNLDAAFVSPWMYRIVMKVGRRIDTKRVVIYHHEAGQQVPGCEAGCVVPKQGDTIAIQ